MGIWQKQRLTTPQEVLGTLALAVVAGIIGYRAYLGSLSPGSVFWVDWVEHYRSQGRCKFDFFLLCMSYCKICIPKLYLAFYVVQVCRIGSARPTRKFADASSKCLTFPGHVTWNRWICKHLYMETVFHHEEAQQSTQGKFPHQSITCS